MSNIKTGQGWRLAAPLAIGGVVALLAIFVQTAASTVAIWHRSETFQHGYIVFPVSIWLIFRKRAEVAALEPRPELRGLILLVLLGLGWLLGHAGSVLVVEQIALVAMIPAFVWTVTGTAVVRTLAFPLAFLLLAVPVGEGLILPLREFTAGFTVEALRLTGIPVYREGMFFVIPSGEWSVIESCSGIRYLIASVTLGLLYAYLTYRTLWRRIAFTVASFVVPVLANGVRAYTIVLTAHLTDNRVAVGLDHILWGWVFFGIIMFLLFLVGSMWREDHLPDVRDQRPVIVAKGPARPLHLAAAAALVIVSLFPTYASWLEKNVAVPAGLTLNAPAAHAGWAPDAPLSDWKPHWIGTDAQAESTYRKGDARVYLFLAWYATQRQGRELVNSQNFMTEVKELEENKWKEAGVALRKISVGGWTANIRETRIRSEGMRLLVWHWNEVAGRRAVNDYLLKLLLATRRVAGQSDEGASVIVAAPYTYQTKEAEAVLREFIANMQQGIAATLFAVAHQP